MLLFCDGFETFSPYDLWRKWGAAHWVTSTSPRINPQIVHGMDNSHFPAQPFARKNDGCALQGPVELFTMIKPSRTLFVGFGFRINTVGSTQPEYTIRFARNVANDKREWASHNDRIYPPDALDQYIKWIAYPTTIAKCVISIEASRIRVRWYFVTGTTTYSFTNTHTEYLNSHSTLNDGSWHYLQVGLTFAGNVAAQPQSWATVRLDKQELAYTSIMTAPESGVGATFQVGAVGLFFGNSDTWFGIYSVDDFYICNDEGDVNNTFLGPIHIKRLTVTGDGSYIDGVPFGDGFRFKTVDESYIDTVNALPSPIPDPESNPLFIEWQDFRSTCLTLLERSDKETVRLSSLNAQGIYPKIYGAVLHSLLNPLYRDTPATIKAIRRLSSGALVESIAMDMPLVEDTEFEHRQFVWENNESDLLPPTWNPPAFDASEWGFLLEPVDIDPRTYDPSVLRFPVIRDELVSEGIGLADFTHRFSEETIEEAIDAGDEAVYEYIWAVADDFGFEETAEMTRAGKRFLNETLEFAEYLPYVTDFGWSELGLDDEAFVQYIDLIGEEIDAADWADGYWEELFEDGFEATDLTDAAFILTLDEAFGLEEPYIWDGHEDVEESLEINVSYVWSGHELIEEYIHPEDYTKYGFGHWIEEALDLAEEHYGGWWVESGGDYADFEDSVLTQHWRYEIIFGMVLDSWQIDPIEQYGNDGSHTGDNPWGA